MKDIAGMRDVACRNARDALRSKKPERIRDLPEDVFDAVEDVPCRRRLPCARGSNFSAGSDFASCSSACRCSFVSFFGTVPWTGRAGRPARGPTTSGMPLPRSRNVVPDCVPSGTFDGSARRRATGT